MDLEAPTPALFVLSPPRIYVYPFGTRVLVFLNIGLLHPDRGHSSASLLPPLLQSFDKRPSFIISDF